MNLHGIVSQIISAVNPREPVTIQFSTGSTSGVDFSRKPAFSVPVAMLGQVQALTTPELRLLDQLNLQGAQRTIYLFGDVQGIVRVSQQGGDLITLADGSIWLTVTILEQWPNWVKAAIKLQNGS